MDSSQRERRDAAGIGPHARELSELSPMSSLDGWSVSKGEPDIRGWEVRTVSGRSLGAVRDLLVDRKAGEVVMVDVDVAGTDRHVPVPIRSVQLDRHARVVLMDSADLGGVLPQPVVVADAARTAAPIPTVLPGDREVVRPAVISETRVPPRTEFGDEPIDRNDPDQTLTRRDAAPIHRDTAERRRAERRRIDRMSTDT